MCYRRELRGWWVVMVASVVFGISGLVTNIFHSVDDIYRLVNLPKPPATPLVALYSSTTFRVGLGGLFLLVYLGILLYTKRYFPQKVDANQPLVLS
jgi:hypothetical protein